MEKKNEDQPQKKFLLDPVYKSTLVYRPSEYYDDAAPKHSYYDEYYGAADVEAQKAEEQKAILAEGASAKRAKRRRTCSLCCCSLFYVSFLLLLAAVIVIIKLIPKDPEISVGAITIPEFVSNQTGSQQQLQASLKCGFNVTNRNSYARAIYKEMTLSAFYKNESLGRFTIEAPGPQFEQSKKMRTTVRADLPSTTTTIGAANAEALQNALGLRTVQLDLIGSVKGQFKVLGMKVKKFDTKIDCKLNVKPGDGVSSREGQNLSFSCYFDS